MRATRGIDTLALLVRLYLADKPVVDAVKPVVPKNNSIDCDVEPGVIVIVDTLRSDGIYVPAPVIDWHSIPPIVGVDGVIQVMPNISATDARVFVPAFLNELLILGEKVSNKRKPVNLL